MRLIILALCLITLAGCNTLGTAYRAATGGLIGYCSLPDITRKATQVVISGRVYDHSICDVINGEVTLARAVEAGSERIVEGQGDE